MNVLRTSSSSQRNRVVYPDPSFDLAHVGFLRVRTSFKWCLRFFTHPIIFAALWKFATYPVTELLFSREDGEGVSSEDEEFYKHTLKLRDFLLNVGLDYSVFGNGYVTLRYPFKKWVQCPECKNWSLVSSFKYRYTSGKFYIERCPVCKDGHFYAEKVEDRYTRSRDGISLIRWNPEDVDVVYTPLMPPGMERRYYLKVPQATANAVKRGKKEVVENLPNSILEAVHKGKRIEVSSRDIYHMRRPAPSKGQYEDGLGIPLILPVLRNAFLLNLLFKAEESIAIDQIIPFRGLYPNLPPGAAAQGYGPSTDRSTSKIQEELEKWFKDRNYVGAFPFAVNEFMLGGRARALMLSPEIQAHSEIILAGMGFPREWAFGGLTFAGSSVSHRMLENYILGYRGELYGCANFITMSVARYLGKPRVRARLRDFRMADDLNRAQFDANLYREGLISRRTLLDSREMDIDEEKRRIEEEARESGRLLEMQRSMMAKAEGEAQKIQARYQIEIQKMQAEAQVEIQKMQAANAPPPPPAPSPGQEGAEPPEGQVAQAPPASEEPPPPAAEYGAAAPPMPQPEQTLPDIISSVERMDPVSRKAYISQLQYTDRALASQVTAGLAARDQQRWSNLVTMPGPAPPTNGAQVPINGAPPANTEQPGQ